MGDFVLVRGIRHAEGAFLCDCARFLRFRCMLAAPGGDPDAIVGKRISKC